MSGGAAMRKNYVKPNMMLRGHKGRAVFELLKNAKPDYEGEAELRKRADEGMAQILAKRNGEKQ